jgi:CRISPR-associated protein Csx10
MIRLGLIATTQTPLMLSGSHEVGNVNTSLEYITGTSLRGACAARFLQNAKIDDSFYQLFCSDDVRFENLYPVYVQLNKGRLPDYFPSQPIPLSARTCKGYSGFYNIKKEEQHGVTDTLCGWHQVKNSTLNCPVCNAALENFEGFYYRDRIDRDWNSPLQVTANSLMTMHNEIEDKSQRSEEGVLFTFDGKDRWQVFIGNIHFMGEQALNDFAIFKKVLQFEKCGEPLMVAVGKRRSGGRGLISVELSGVENTAFPPRDVIYEDFDQRFDEYVLRAEMNNDNNGVSFTVTLFSDAIVTDHWLRSKTALTADVLMEELQLENADELELIKPFFSASRIVSGWNDAHKLPKIDEIAIEKGASFRYRFKGQKEEIYEKLRKLEQDGIGFRRNEGFGRVIINHPFHWGGIDKWAQNK